MILLALIVGGFIAFIYYCLVFWGAIFGVGASKLEEGTKDLKVTTLDYLDEQIGTDNRVKLMNDLVNNDCNCKIEYHKLKKVYYFEPIGNNNVEEIKEILKKYGVDNTKLG